jgi:hypothetical protein
MSRDMGSTTTSRTITNSTGFLAIVLVNLDHVNPDPIEDSSRGRRCWNSSRSTEHSLFKVVVQLNMFCGMPFGPGISLLQLLTGKARSGSRNVVDQGMLDGLEMVLDDLHLIEVQLWEASMTRCVDDLVESESD